MASTTIIPHMCANCGKDGEEIGHLKTCVACKEVKYCNRDCQIAHRPKHKKACKKRAAKLYDEKLFKEIEHEECPICMLPLPRVGYTSTFRSCCGKRICNGCIDAMRESEGGDLCPFCRTPAATSEEEEIKRTKKLAEAGNAEAFNQLGGHYEQGSMGMPQNYEKANELYLKAGELGCAGAYYNCGVTYGTGRGVEVDMKKANYYFELAAMKGGILARNNLACFEGEAGNYERAFKHYMIAARAGFKTSLDAVKLGYENGIVTKEQYASTLRAYHERQKEMKSDDRDKAAHVRANRATR